ncbi:hypothetical protein BaRGS_00032645 [Batillaria attramentaria]|uniref:Uncharacterized protein n=1 Tax=Batillaria attramentaria TaxID=370345 RepID=A0ABD0JMC6_9CAEN
MGENARTDGVAARTEEIEGTRQYRRSVAENSLYNRLCLRPVTGNTAKRDTSAWSSVKVEPIGQSIAENDELCTVLSLPRLINRRRQWLHGNQ